MTTKTTIAPFRGIRYNLEKVDLSRVVAPPYDVISEKKQKELYERDPHNVVRLILGYQFADDHDHDNRYTRSALDLKTWQEDKTLVRDAEPCFYLYEQHFTIPGRGVFARRGFLALRRLEDFEDGKIMRHEKTLSGPKADRLLLTKACQANLSPIFSLYSDPEKQITKLMESHYSQTPQADFTDEEGIRQRFWKVHDIHLFEKANELLRQKSLFIADGHHRYETAIAYREYMKKLHPDSREDASFNYVMMFFSEMSDPGLLILPTHRVIQNWPGFQKENFITRLKEFFEIETFSAQQEEASHSKLKQAGEQGSHMIGLAFPDSSDLHLLKFRSIEDDISYAVDTGILHKVILQKILGFEGDQDKDPKFIRFIKDAKETLSLKSEPGVNCVFLMNSPSMASLSRVVEAGQILPPKTTFFYPKLLSGLVINPVY